MSDEVKTCADCKHFIVDVGFRHGVCEIKRSRIDKWGQERTIRRMASCKACKRALPKQEPTDAMFFIGTREQVEEFKKLWGESDISTHVTLVGDDENKQLSDAVNVEAVKSENRELNIALFKAEHDRDRYKRKIMELNAEIKMLRLQMFAFVRNSAVLPVGRCLNKSEQEITDKTFETIEAAKAMLDVEAVKELMNLASNKENRYDIY